MSLIRACAHFTNYTAGHETRTHLPGERRFDYPPSHIEADNRLSWLLGRLDRHFGDRATYVHLQRDPEEVAQSFRERAKQGIFKAYSRDILARSETKASYVAKITHARDLVDTINENINLFLRDKTHVREIHVDRFAADFRDFAEWIGARGDLTAAEAELETRHNAGAP